MSGKYKKSIIWAVIYILGLIKVGFIFSFYSDSGFCGRRPGRLDRSVKAFVDFIGSSPARKNKRFCFSLAYSKNSLTVGTPRKLVRHYRSGVQKKQDDTRPSSNGPRTRTPPTYVITAWQAKPDLKTINFSEKRFSGKVTQLSIIR